MKHICIILFILTFKTLIYANDLVIEMGAIINKHGDVDARIDSVIRHYKYKRKNVSVLSFEPIDHSKEDIIKSRFLVSNFYYNKNATKKITSSKKKHNFYAKSDEMINLLDKNDLKYVQVINDIESAKHIGDEYLLKIRNKNDKELLIANSIKESIGIKMNKDDIIVIDGDTIDYHKVRYRLLGVDAPEMAQAPYGSIASNFVYQQIKNADSVYINVCSFDIYDRVLAHIFIETNSLAIMLLENRLAIQTVTTYGDNGFPDIAQHILEYSLNNRKRLPFLSPRTFRQRQRKENAQTNQ